MAVLVLLSVVVVVVVVVVVAVVAVVAVVTVGTVRNSKEPQETSRNHKETAREPAWGPPHGAPPPLCGGRATPMQLSWATSEPTHTHKCRQILTLF